MCAALLWRLAFFSKHLSAMCHPGPGTGLVTPITQTEQSSLELCGRAVWSSVGELNAPLVRGRRAALELYGRAERSTADHCHTDPDLK